MSPMSVRTGTTGLNSPGHRRHLARLLRGLQWPLVAVAAIVAVVLGCWGFARFFDSLNGQHTFWDLLYRDMQLFTFKAGDVSGAPVPWQLQIARFLAPAVTMVAAGVALAALLGERLRLARLRFFHDHTVVCGLGRKGLRVVEDLRGRGERVVVIERDVQNESLARCRELGALALIGSGTDVALLRRARADRARRVVAVCRDDGVNAEIALACREVALGRRGPPLTCFVHVVDAHLCKLLHERGLRPAGEDALRLEFFDVHERGARGMLQEWPPFADGPAAAPHLLVVGCGRMGEELVAQAARQWSRRGVATDSRFWVTIVDHAALAKRETLERRYPRLAEFCQLVPLELDITTPEFERAGFLGGGDDEPPAVSVIYICLDDDSRSLAAALALLRRTRGSGVPIVARMSEQTGLASLVARRDGTSDYDDLHVFGVVAHVCSADRLLLGVHETLARAIHEDYVLGRLRMGVLPEDDPALSSWELLPTALRDSNLGQADDIIRKLAAVDCDIAPLVDWYAGPLRFDVEEVERMAQMEHDRWVRERVNAGWVYAAGVKHVAQHTSPYLIPWRDLPEDQKEKTRRMVCDLPAFLATVGLQVVRRPHARAE